MESIQFKGFHDNIRGDVNSDGTVDIADVVSVLNIMAERYMHKTVRAK